MRKLIKNCFAMLFFCVNSSIYAIADTELAINSVVPSSANQESLVKNVTPIESLMPMLLGLIVILGVIFLLAAILKRFSNFNQNTGQIQVIECHRLGTKEKLLIVEVQGKQILLGVTPQNISQLGELDYVEREKKSPLSFDSLMKQLLLKQNNKNTESSAPNSSIKYDVKNND